MKSSQSNPDPRDSQWDSSDPVWRLLGESPRPEPDAWFATRTMARCREAAWAAETKAVTTVSHIWRWALGGGLGVCLVVFLIVPRVNSTPTTATTQTNVQQAFAIMASIDTSDSDTDSDSSSSSSSSWQDSSSL